MDNPLTKLDFSASVFGFFASFAFLGCDGPADATRVPADPDPEPETASPVDAPSADIVGVSVAGGPDAWTVSVTVRSDDTGCEQYADWWEIVSLEETLIYRRVLRHSHPGEQPFTRSSEVPIQVDSHAALYVRAHLSPGGYGGAVFGGTMSDGFVETNLGAGFGAGLEEVAPQPEGCLY